MAPWDLTLTLDPKSEVPLYLQLTRRLIEAIANGRIAPGIRLPGSRALAKTLGVHRNTVHAAYDELVAEGWITSSARSGTFVSRSLPASETIASKPSDGPGRAVYSVPRPPDPWRPTPSPTGGVDLTGGRPDLNLVPAVELARAYSRSLRRLRTVVLEYGDPQGEKQLRVALAQMLRATRGLGVSEKNILITNGSQMALHVATRTLIRAGEAVAVEAPGYPAAWRTLRAAGARLLPVPVDAEGLRVDKLARLTDRDRIRAVYLTPHHQYPTTVPLSPRRRMELLRLARDRRFAILEDDYDHEVHFDGHPLVPLASADRLETALYLGSLSKIFAPGVRLGYVVAPEEVVASLVAHRSAIDLSGNSGLELAVAQLIEEGAIQHHLRRMASLYRGRRDALVAGLRSRFGGDLEFGIPSGGTAVWCVARRLSSLDGWVDRCRAAGVLFQRGSHFAFRKRSIPAVRIGFTRATEAEIARALRLMAGCWAN